MTLAIQQADADISNDVKSVLEAAFAQYATKAELLATKSELSLEISKTATKEDLTQLRIEFLEKLADTKSELMRWMFVFWVGQVAVTVALVKFIK